MGKQFVVLLSIFLLVSACESSNNSDGTSGTPPSTSNIEASIGLEDVESIISLTYSDAESDLAASCTLSNLSNLTETTACSCDVTGACSVGVTGTLGYYGSVSFDYAITAASQTSTASAVTFKLHPQLGAAPTNEEWVEVPANAGSMGLASFYVMKYEAKAFNDADADELVDVGEVDAVGTAVATGSNRPISIASNLPWRNINGDDAASECESLGANYHLISNAEWMAIAREVESQTANWTGGAVGSGCIFRGNSGDATVGTGSTLGDSCGYDGQNPEDGTGRDTRATHTLSNGENILDIAGNIHEWTDWDKTVAGFQTGGIICTGAWLMEFTVANCVPSLATSEYTSANASYSSVEGIGKLFDGGNGAAPFRGGAWNPADYAGIFTLSTWGLSTGIYANVGLRCVYRP